MLTKRQINTRHYVRSMFTSMKLKRRKISLYESPKRNKKCTREKRNKVKEVNSTDITSQNARHTEPDLSAYKTKKPHSKVRSSKNVCHAFYWSYKLRRFVSQTFSVRGHVFACGGVIRGRHGTRMDRNQGSFLIPDS